MLPWLLTQLGPRSALEAAIVNTMTLVCHHLSPIPMELSSFMIGTYCFYFSWNFKTFTKSYFWSEYLSPTSSIIVFKHEKAEFYTEGFLFSWVLINFCSFPENISIPHPPPLFIQQTILSTRSRYCKYPRLFLHHHSQARIYYNVFVTAVFDDNLNNE